MPDLVHHDIEQIGVLVPILVLCITIPPPFRGDTNTVYQAGYQVQFVANSEVYDRTDIAST